MPKIEIICLPDRTDPHDADRFINAGHGLYAKMVWRPYRFDEGFTGAAIVIDGTRLLRTVDLAEQTALVAATLMPEC